MRTRSLSFIAWVLVCATAAVAADPIVGTWKLNVAKSKYAPGQTAPTAGMEVYREIEGNQIELTFTRTTANGSLLSSKYAWPAQGGDVKILQHDAQGTSFVETLIVPGDWYVTVLQGGKQIRVRHKTCSKDGKTMVQTIKETDAKGKVVEGLEVFDRQ